MGYLNKKSGGRYTENICQTYCIKLFRRWLQRWCIITNEGIIYTIDSNSTRAREHLLFDQSFQIEFDRQKTGIKRGLALSTSNRRLQLRADTTFGAIDWILSIKEAVSECPYVQVNRYLSFAPVRPATSECKWYVDGEGYFRDVCDALLSATKEVFITDWWLSPELYLKRPVRDGDMSSRLDHVLKKIADSGVKVLIILYREVKLALYNDSEYTKKTLQNLSENIKVLRHPNEILFKWSHHEKIVVIDQSVGFLGGLDLCYGRMDINSHPLHDPEFKTGTGHHTFPGIDFSNSRNADFRDVRDYTNCLVDKAAHPRMPWHDIAMMVVGDPVRDLSRHFIQYWNFAEIDLRFRKDQLITSQQARKTKHFTANNQAVQPKSDGFSKLKNRFSQLIHHKKGSQASGSLYHKMDDHEDDRTAPVEKDAEDRFELYVESKTRLTQNFGIPEERKASKTRSDLARSFLPATIEEEEESKIEERGSIAKANPFMSKSSNIERSIQMSSPEKLDSKGTFETLC